ncbi:hypothetical protein [Oceanicaulis alexandrii]|uniref:hypothetical protein n=1 Tax=Oceanicaulis alexandrii TaxID=153233 RepID=UPI0023555E5B|nr:hypothetical protein [Oceanicaulis alexandrii]
MTDIDCVLKKIAEEPVEADLITMEAEVWERIEKERFYAETGLTGFSGPVRILTSPAAAILSALLIGAMIGATSLQGAGPTSPMSAFSASTPYAPSTLLGGAPR